ncbi:MAG: hypothetical protein JSR33_00515 [Proteobacteria bacterium]|nr:hypothetical protein [Pseudomonadota bacterium]
MLGTKKAEILEELLGDIKNDKPPEPSCKRPLSRKPVNPSLFDEGFFEEKERDFPALISFETKPFNKPSPPSSPRPVKPALSIPSQRGLDFFTISYNSNSTGILTEELLEDFHVPLSFFQDILGEVAGLFFWFGFKCLPGTQQKRLVEILSPGRGVIQSALLLEQTLSLSGFHQLDSLWGLIATGCSAIVVAYYLFAYVAPHLLMVTEKILRKNLLNKLLLQHLGNNDPWIPAGLSDIDLIRWLQIYPNNSNYKNRVFRLIRPEDFLNYTVEEAEEYKKLINIAAILKAFYPVTVVNSNLAAISMPHTYASQLICNYALTPLFIGLSQKKDHHQSELTLLNTYQSCLFGKLAVQERDLNAYRPGINPDAKPISRAMRNQLHQNQKETRQQLADCCQKKQKLEAENVGPILSGYDFAKGFQKGCATVSLVTGIPLLTIKILFISNVISWFLPGNILWAPLVFSVTTGIIGLGYGYHTCCKKKKPKSNPNKETVKLENLHVDQPTSPIYIKNNQDDSQEVVETTSSVSRADKKNWLDLKTKHFKLSKNPYTLYKKKDQDDPFTMEENKNGPPTERNWLDLKMNYFHN